VISFERYDGIYENLIMRDDSIENSAHFMHFGIRLINFEWDIRITGV